MNQNEKRQQLIEYIRKDKPKKLLKDFKFKEPLTQGWMLPYLFPLETVAWGRWDHWGEIQYKQTLAGPIPQIDWCGEHGDGSTGRRMWEKALDAITGYGDWRGWSSHKYVEYLFDWLLFAFGDSKHPTEPETPGQECSGASERLYQIFNLEPILAYPHDYLGDIMAEQAFGRASGFFPTPMEIASMMVKIQMGEEDMRAKSVSDPCVGTGRMILCASNYSYRLYGQDVNNLCCKATMINGYLYAPWLVKPFAFLANYASAEPDAAQIPNLVQSWVEIEQPNKGQLQLV